MPRSLRLLAPTVGVAILVASCGSGCRLVQRGGPVPPEVADARRLCNEGLSAADRADLVRAEGLLEQAVARCPVDVDARKHYADVLWQRGLKMEAVGQIRQSGTRRRVEGRAARHGDHRHRQVDPGGSGLSHEPGLGRDRRGRPSHRDPRRDDHERRREGHRDERRCAAGVDAGTGPLERTAALGQRVPHHGEYLVAVAGWRRKAGPGDEPPLDGVEALLVEVAHQSSSRSASAVRSFSRA